MKKMFLKVQSNLNPMSQFCQISIGMIVPMLNNELMLIKIFPKHFMKSRPVVKRKRKWCSRKKALLKLWNNQGVYLFRKINIFRYISRIFRKGIIFVILSDWLIGVLNGYIWSQIMILYDLKQILGTEKCTFSHFYHFLGVLLNVFGNFCRSDRDFL